MAGERTGSFVTSVLVPLLTGVVAVGTFVLQQRVARLDQELRAREAARQDQAEVRLAGQQEMETRFRIYDAVVKSLESGDARKQRVAASLVVSLLGVDDSLRTSLLSVLDAQGEPAVRTEVRQLYTEAARFQEDQAQLRAAVVRPGTAGDWRELNMDVFWCETSPNARRLADGVAEGLQRADAKGRVRVRVLSESINRSPGYRIAGNVIRAEAGERDAAEALKAVADAALRGAGGGFTVGLSRQSTPGYVSLFVCG
jgi:hypothetical protein